MRKLVCYLPASLNGQAFYRKPVGIQGNIPLVLQPIVVGGPRICEPSRRHPREHPTATAGQAMRLHRSGDKTSQWASKGTSHQLVSQRCSRLRGRSTTGTSPCWQASEVQGGSGRSRALKRWRQKVGVCLPELAARERSVGEDVGDLLATTSGILSLLPLETRSASASETRLVTTTGIQSVLASETRSLTESEILLATRIQPVRQWWHAGKRAAAAAQGVIERPLQSCQAGEPLARPKATMRHSSGRGKMSMFAAPIGRRGKVAKISCNLPSSAPSDWTSHKSLRPRQLIGSPGAGDVESS
jgi:hypothetical protein